jgi:DNA-directed RNA polymerase beta' subunit
MDKIKQFESDNHVLITLPKKPSDSEIKKVLSNTSTITWNPTSIINYISNKEMEQQIEYKKTQNKIKNNLMTIGDIEAVKRITMVLEKSEFQKSLYLVFAVTEGTNLENIFKLPDVDSNYTISNIPSEIVKYFGIEAAR